MTDNSSERALLAILALEPEESSLSDTEAQAFAKGPLPTLDVRVEKFMRAMRDGESGAGDPAEARELILTAMARDLANGSEQNRRASVSCAFRNSNQSFQPGSKAFALGVSGFGFRMVP